MKEHSDELLAEATRDELFACIRLLAISVVQHRAKCGFVTFKDSATQLRSGTSEAEEFGLFVEGKQVLEEALEMAKSFATESPLGLGVDEPPSNLLAEKLAGSGVVCNALCPGLIDTNLLSNNRDFGPALMARLRSQMRPPADGAITPVYLATATEAADITGAFFIKSHGNGKTPLQLDWDRATAFRLWQISEEMVAPWLDKPGI